MIDRNPGVEDSAGLQRDGYVVVRDFFDRDSLTQLLKWTEELQTAPEVPGRHWVYRENSITAAGHPADRELLPLSRRL
jgi:2-aminoethylphosphonate dioxygenase